MSAFKDKNTGKWNAYFRYTDWKGKRQQKLKRGFPTKREALEWEREFLQQKTADMYMTFGAFVEIYSGDIKERLKLNTWLTKEHIIQTKLIPAFGERKISEISPKDIIQWQNEMIVYRDENGKAYSATYLKTLHNQLSCIFNHAVRYYELKSNPAAKAGNMGKEKSKEMLFWTKDEYMQFADAMMDKPLSYYAFEILYWCGIRVGELLALTAEDFNFTKGTVTINKSYQRLNGNDVVTEPKTEKSNRVIKMPDFLCEEMQDYLKSLYAHQPKDRIFPVSKHYLHHEMDRGCKETGVKRIRIHDIRHSHVSLLIEMGFSAGNRNSIRVEKRGLKYTIPASIAFVCPTPQTHPAGIPCNPFQNGGFFMRTHTKTFHIRFTEKEYNRLFRDAKKAGLPKTTYIRHMINGCQPKEAPPPEFWSFMKELRRIGNNLNQITNLAHKFGSLHTAKLDDALKEFHQFYMAIFDRMIPPDDLDVPATLEQGKIIAEIENNERNS